VYDAGGGVAKLIDDAARDAEALQSGGGGRK